MFAIERRAAMADPASGLVWNRDRRTPRRQAPSVDQIVARAIAIADAEGADALSMRRVAADLGSGTASLYRYVASRDELLDLMIDAVRGEEEPPTLSGDWRIDLTNVARRLRAALLRHPWLGSELTGRPTLGPNSLRHADVALGAAAALTPDITLAANVVDAALAYVFGAVAGELAEVQAQRRTGLTQEQWQASVGPYIREVIDSEAYPHFARRVVEAEDPDPEQRFEFGLACVLDGVAARAHGRTEHGPGNCAPLE
jgi:AcrR family transcriptional regulator